MVRELALNIVVLLLATRGVALVAQTSAMPQPGFKLTLSEGRRDATMVSWQTKLVVRFTNTSNGIIREDACSAAGGLYKLSVVYNGVPVQEPEDVRKSRESVEAAEAKGGLCSGSVPGRHIQPGEHWEDTFAYNTTNSGTYEFTVEEKAFLQEPEKTVTVKSNTVTVIVAESHAGVAK
jgi:hypothetical protein